MKHGCNQTASNNSIHIVNCMVASSPIQYAKKEGRGMVQFRINSSLPLSIQLVQKEGGLPTEEMLFTHTFFTGLKHTLVVASDTSIGPCSDCCIPLLVSPVLYCELLGTDPQLPATPDQKTELLLNSTHSLVHRLPHFTFSLLIIHALFVYYCQCKRNNKTSLGTMLHHVATTINRYSS